VTERDSEKTVWLIHAL